MYYAIIGVVAVNLLAITLPITIRIGFIFADWIDEQIESWQRGK